jgi:putative chitinase
VSAAQLTQYGLATLIKNTKCFMNKKLFYDIIRPVFGPLKQSQVDGFEAILNEWLKRGLTDKRWLAYILATAWHETAKTMQPVEEFGKGKGRSYGKPDPATGHVYYGRGHVQLTHPGNYKRMGKVIDVDLYNHPELALQMDNSVKIMFDGMLSGVFTGRKLNQYFNDKKEDWINARRIINGLDRAELIAGYAKTFYKASL